MRALAPACGVLAALSLYACSKSDTSPAPENSRVAGAMPDAAATPGAQGPSTAAPHGAPPAATTLSDTHPTPAGPAPTPPPKKNLSATETSP